MIIIKIILYMLLRVFSITLMLSILILQPAVHIVILLLTGLKKLLCIAYISKN